MKRSSALSWLRGDAQEAGAAVTSLYAVHTVKLGHSVSSPFFIVSHFYDCQRSPRDKQMCWRTCTCSGTVVTCQHRLLLSCSVATGFLLLLVSSPSLPSCTRCSGCEVERNCSWLPPAACICVSTFTELSSRFRTW